MLIPCFVTLGCDASGDDDEIAFRDEAIAIELEWDARADLNLSLNVPAGLSPTEDFDRGEDMKEGPGYEFILGSDDRSLGDFDGEYTLTVMNDVDDTKPTVQPIPFEIRISSLGTGQTRTGTVQAVAGQLSRELRFRKEGSRIVLD